MAGPGENMVRRAFRRAAGKGTRAACVPGSVGGRPPWSSEGGWPARGFGQDARNDRLEAGATRSECGTWRVAGFGAQARRSSISKGQ